MTRTDRQLLDAIARAWNDEGRNPSYHRMQQMRLVKEWPTLAAIVQAVATSKERYGRPKRDPETHLPECIVGTVPEADPQRWCICERLRDCEQRMKAKALRALRTVVSETGGYNTLVKCITAVEEI